MPDAKRTCENCAWWKKDWGIFTATGWTGMGRNDGHCHYEPRPIVKRGNDRCHNWTPKEAVR